MLKCSQTSFRHFWDDIMKKFVDKPFCDENLKSFNSVELKNFNIDKDITPHTFRHTYGTMLHYAGADIKTAQYLLGHSSIQVTMDIYTHLENESINSSVDKISRYLSNKLTSKELKIKND